MAAGNGFLTARPDAVIDGAVAANGSARDCYAQRFLLDTTGTVEIAEIGWWGRDSGDRVRLAIFTDDAGNTCPESIVDNSDCEATFPASPAQVFYHTYGTKPVLTGGSSYWIVALLESDAEHYRATSGGTGLYKINITYPTWPSATAWETHTDYAANRMLYAVYEAASGQFARPSSDVAGGTFRSILVTAPFGPRVIA